MSDFPGLFAGIGHLPAHRADSIAQVEALFGDPAGGVTEHGTGFLVRRKDNTSFLATAAHVLFKRAFGYSQQVTMLLGQHSDGCAAAITVESGPQDLFFVPDEFRNQLTPPAGSDYGLVRIIDPQARLAKFHHFVASSADPMQSIVRLYGYPKDG